MKQILVKRFNDLMLDGTHESVEKALDILKKTSKESSRAWKLADDVSDDHRKEMESLISEGFSEREAARLVGAYSEPSNFYDPRHSNFSPSKPSSKMLDMVRGLANDIIRSAKDHDMKEASAEKNPVLYGQGKMDQHHKSFDDALSAAVKGFIESDEYKGASKFKRGAMLSKFKAGWVNTPEGQEAAKAFGEGYRAHQDAGSVRSEFLYSVGQHMTTGGSTGEESGNVSASEALQHVVGSTGGGEEGDQPKASFSKDPLVSFGSKNPKLMQHLQDKLPEMKDRMNRLKGAESFSQPTQQKEQVDQKPKIVIRRRSKE
jgi:hypothetical protein